MIFAIVYAHGAQWVEGTRVQQQPHMADHARFLQQLFDEKKLLMAGPLTDNWGGLAIIDVADAQEAEAILARDPILTHEVLAAELHPWQQYWNVFTGKNLNVSTAPASSD